MTIDNVTANSRAEELFAGILSHVSGATWDHPSACAKWTVRDVVGHVVWGRRLLASCAAGQEEPDRRGAPGADKPSELLGGDPAEAFAAARKAADESLTDEGRAKPAPELLRKANPEATVDDFVKVLVADLVIHAWDIASSVHVPFEVDDELLDFAMEATSGGVRRSPDFFGAELPAPADGDRVEQYMAYLGREPRHTSDWSADDPNPS